VSQFKRSKINKNFYQSLPKRLLIDKVRVIDPSQKLDQIQSIIVANGKIADILSASPENFDGEVLSPDDGIVMPGFFDMHVHLREPGREDEETIESGSYAAANGGFTGVACMPNTQPAIDSQEVVNYIKEQEKSLLVDVHPIATISKERQGKELSPIAELVEAGAVAISDDGSPVMNAELMRRALEYSKMFDIPVLGHEEDINLSKNRHMHEGFYSTKLGIPAIPSISEDVMIMRDIMITEFTDGKFHVCHISTRGGVELVRRAKEKGLKITCEVTPHHFTLTDQCVESFDTNTKMNPPLRSENDKEALIEGLKDGTIDVIATDHAPHSIEEKEAEYIYAPFGIIGLESAWGLIVSQLISKGILTFNDIYDRCVANPRRILNLSVPKIKKGETVNLTVVNSNQPWKLKDRTSFSKSNNSPFMEYPLAGKNIAVINNGKIFYSQ
jgi:dihydroorotase